MEITPERANEIMEEATTKAAELLSTKPKIAEIILKQLLKVDPEHYNGLSLLGLTKHRLGKNAEAVEIIQTTIELDPQDADNYNTLGLAYAGLGKHERAIESIKKAIELNPSQHLFLNNLALQYRIVRDYPKAIATLEHAISLFPDSANMWSNLGGIHGELKDIQKAMKCFQEALEIDPYFAPAHVDLAFAHHLLGEWQAGFKHYDWRFEYFEQMKYYLNAFDQRKRWNGKDSLEGKKILIYAEQGLGDCIQFMRFLPLLNCDVTVHCPPTLNRVVSRFATPFNCDIVDNPNIVLPEHDYQCAIMSLPYLLNIHDFSGKPYISSNSNFRSVLEKDYPAKLRIGLVWAGSPAHPHDQKRSIPLKHFREICSLPNVRVFSLQFDMRPRKYGFDMRPCAEGKVIDFAEGCEDMKLVDLTTVIQDMEDTVNILAGLDLVIACDTSIVHLAGAIGIPCFLLLPYNCDWRWCVSGDKTVWYDSVELFRQPDRDDWSTPISAIKAKLETLLQN